FTTLLSPTSPLFPYTTLFRSELHEPPLNTPSLSRSWSIKTPAPISHHPPLNWRTRRSMFVMRSSMLFLPVFGSAYRSPPIFATFATSPSFALPNTAWSSSFRSCASTLTAGPGRCEPSLWTGQVVWCHAVHSSWSSTLGGPHPRGLHADGDRKSVV